jgi:hypothetical protein
MSVARFVWAGVLSVAGLMSIHSPSLAETVGKAVLIRTTVVGANGTMAPRDPVSRDELIRTNATGLGQFRFDDGSKLAVGPNASIVIDEYVLGDGNRLTKMALNTVKGAFRWISGKSPSSAYRIETRFGTLGVRGTAVDGYIGNDVVMFVLLKGGITFCQGSNCVEVDKPCDFIVAKAGSISEPKQISTASVREYGKASVPFLLNNSRLLPSMRLAKRNCSVGLRFSTSSGTVNDPDPQGPPRNNGSGNTPRSCQGEGGGYGEGGEGEGNRD